MFGKLRSSLRKSLRWKPSRDRHADRSGADGGDAILGTTSAAASSVPHSSSSSTAHNDATPSNSGSNTAGAGSDNAANNKVPRQWQLDESAVRAGTCAFAVKYLGCAEVFESRGMHVCEQALVVLRDNMVHRKPQRAILYVSGEGLRVVDSKSRNLLVDQTIEKVSFCSPDRNHSKGFAYICRDGTTRRWICHGFNAVADTGERLSHAVGCAFQECLQRKQMREKQLRSKQNVDSLTSPTGNSASPNNFSPAVGSSVTTANNLNRVGLSNTIEAPKTALLTGNQMNANFQRGTHRTQSLADRRLDPQAFVKVDKPPPASAATGVPAAYAANDPVMADSADLQPQEFRRAQSSRVFSTQFVRQRVRSSMRGADAPAATARSVTAANPGAVPASTVVTNNADAFPRSLRHASGNQQQQYPFGQQTPSNYQAGFYNPGINFASPTGSEVSSSFRRVDTNSPLPVSAAPNTSISSPSTNLQSSSIRNEILDLCARINNQDFSSGQGLSSLTTATPIEADLRVPQPHTDGNVQPTMARASNTNNNNEASTWNYAPPSVAGGAPAVRTVPIPPRSGIMPNFTTRNHPLSDTSNARGAVPDGTANVENTHYYHINSSRSSSGAASATNGRAEPKQRPNNLPTAPLSAKCGLAKQSSVVAEEDEDPFSPPGWVDKKSAVFASFPSPPAIPASNTMPQQNAAANSHDRDTFHNHHHFQQEQKSLFGRVPFDQLRDDEDANDINGSSGSNNNTPRRNPTPAEPTIPGVNGTAAAYPSADYVPAEYFSRQQPQYRYKQQQSEPDPFNTTWVKLDTE